MKALSASQNLSVSDIVSPNINAKKAPEHYIKGYNSDKIIYFCLCHNIHLSKIVKKGANLSQ